MFHSPEVREGQAPGPDLAGASRPLLPQPGQTSPHTEENVVPVAQVPCFLLQTWLQVTQTPLRSSIYI